MTNELVINGTTYEFNFGMGFIRQIDPLHKQSAQGIEQNIGLVVEMAKIIEGDIIALCEALRIANKGFKPRLEQTELDKWIENPDTDIDGVFEAVLGFFENSNCCKRTYRRLTEDMTATFTQE